MVFQKSIIEEKFAISGRFEGFSYPHCIEFTIVHQLQIVSLMDRFQIYLVASRIKGVVLINFELCKA